LESAPFYLFIYLFSFTAHVSFDIFHTHWQLMLRESTDPIRFTNLGLGELAQNNRRRFDYNLIVYRSIGREAGPDSRDVNFMPQSGEDGQYSKEATHRVRSGTEGRQDQKNQRMQCTLQLDDVSFHDIPRSESSGTHHAEMVNTLEYSKEAMHRVKSGTEGRQDQKNQETQCTLQLDDVSFHDIPRSESSGTHHAPAHHQSEDLDRQI
jgi:hypothetical protein